MQTLVGVWKLVEARAFDEAGLKRFHRRSVRTPWVSRCSALNV